MTTTYEQLEQWRTEIVPDMPTLQLRYLDIGDRLGQCNYFQDGSSIITINTLFQGKQFTEKIIAWHEFCHAWQWYQEKQGGHEKGWISRWISKPFLSIIGYLLIAPIVIYSYIKDAA